MALRKTKTLLENELGPSREEMKKRCRRVCRVVVARKGASNNRIGGEVLS